MVTDTFPSFGSTKPDKAPCGICPRSEFAGHRQDRPIYRSNLF